MARWGRCDFEELKRLQERLKTLERIDLDKFCRDASKELAARLLALVIPATPVGQYPKSTGKKGGTLRRGWTGNKNTGAKTYAQSLEVHKIGDNYIIEVINPVEYASYVEFGHRTRGGGFVKGKFMLTLSEGKLRQMAPGILQRKLDKFLREVINGEN